MQPATGCLRAASPLVVRTGEAARRAQWAVLDRDGQTVRKVALAPPRGVDPRSVEAVVCAAGVVACDPGAVVPVDALPRASGADATPDLHPPTEIDAETRARLRGLGDAAFALLAEGNAPSDPDPEPPAGVLAFDPSALAYAQDTTQPHEPAPPTPSIEDYIRYELPPDTPGRYLETVNGHPRDGLLRFEELSHTYFVRREDGAERPTNGSVTKLCKRYTEPFDGPAIVGRMMRGENWPRVRYLHNAVRVASLAELQEAPMATVALLDARGRVLAHAPLSTGKLRSAAVALHVGERPMSADEVTAQWQILGCRAANRGTEAHFQIELFMNRDTCSRTMSEMRSFAIFVRDVMQPLRATAYRTEWRVFCTTANVAGSIDCVVQLPDGRLGIVDWKRSVKVREQVERRSPACRKRMKAPMEHLPDCDVACYALQLSLYAAILRRHYGVEVVFLALAQVHPQDAFYTFVPDLRVEAEFILAERRLDNALDGAHRASQAADGTGCDPASAKPCDAQTAEAAEAEVAAARAEVAEARAALDEGYCFWNRYVPREGVTVEDWQNGALRRTSRSAEQAGLQGLQGRARGALFHTGLGVAGAAGGPRDEKPPQGRSRRAAGSLFQTGLGTAGPPGSTLRAAEATRGQRKRSADGEANDGASKKIAGGRPAAPVSLFHTGLCVPPAARQVDCNT